MKPEAPCAVTVYCPGARPANVWPDTSVITIPCSRPAASAIRTVAFDTGFGAHAGSGGNFSTGQTGPATAVMWRPVSDVMPPPPGDGHASEGTGDPASDWSVTNPVGPTAYVQVCSSMQPAGQSPQPMRIVTMKAPTPDAGTTSYQFAWPIRFGSRAVIPVKRGFSMMTRWTASAAVTTGPAADGTGEAVGAIAEKPPPQLAATSTTITTRSMRTIRAVMAPRRRCTG